MSWAAPTARRPGDRYAQGFLTTCNLPDTLERLRSWVGDDPRNAGTLVDNVLTPGPDEPFTWTVPARVGAGDVAFFHYAARAAALVVRLRRAAAREGVLDAGLADFLDYAAEQAADYAGRVFAYGILSGPAEPGQPSGDGDPHWRSRLYAPFASVYELGMPLLVRDHTDVLTQPTKTITELTAAQFGALKERLVDAGNVLSEDLASAIPGRDDFDGISPRTWRRVACRPEQQFRHEADVRGFFADYLVEEIKDSGSPVYREVRCVGLPPATRGRGAAAPRPRGTARADYIVRIDGEWTPVEAKLSLWAWPDILTQVAQYTSAAAYEVRAAGVTPTRIPAGAAGVCLVIDQRGIYLVRGGAFYRCDRGRPLWSRLDLGCVCQVA